MNFIDNFIPSSDTGKWKANTNGVVMEITQHDWNSFEVMVRNLNTGSITFDFGTTTLHNAFDVAKSWFIKMKDKN